MEAALSDGRPYLLGENFSLAEAYLFVMITWSPMMGLDLARWPRIQNLGERVSERAAVKAALAAEARMKLAA
jgi:glutathione S-transferase